MLFHMITQAGRNYQKKDLLDEVNKLILFTQDQFARFNPLTLQIAFYSSKLPAIFAFYFLHIFHYL